MSKGSKRRVGKPGAYEEGYDRIFGKPQEATEEDHAAMNRARIRQSLPADYLEWLVKATKPKVS